MSFKRSKEGWWPNGSVAVICTGGINAVGIALSLREIGWEGRIICLKADNGQFVPADGWPNLCECIPVNFKKPSDMPHWLQQQIPPDSLKAVFFTDERFLPVFSEKTVAETFSNVRFHIGTATHLDETLDKMKFYEFVRKNNLAEVPRSIPSDEDPRKIFQGPFRVRVWKSWSGVDKLSRGGMARNDQDIQRWKERLASSNLISSDWGYQELLCSNPRHKYAVSGWHDDDTRLYVTTRWVKERRENGWIIERAADPGGLQDATQRILSALNYCGPFEMEFMKDLKSDTYKVLELNPRFWLQHRIVGRELVRLYLGDAAPARREAAVNSAEERAPQYWINTYEAIWRLLTLRNLNLLPLYFQNLSALPWRGALRTTLAIRLSVGKQRISRMMRDRTREEPTTNHHTG